jgi:predicted DsbA family dithiol-disulfide isomerase
VYGVPKTVINELVHLEGAVPEHMLLDAVLTVMNDQEMARLKQEWDRHGHVY